MTTTTESIAPSCWDQITDFNVNFGERTQFDQGYGSVVLTEGNQCWDDVREAFQATGDFIVEQLALAAGQEVDAEGVVEAAEEATGITAIINAINDYTDAHLLISYYSWKEEDVIDGESIGVCHKPTASEGGYGSCWEYRMDEFGQYDAVPYSYLIDLDLINADTTLDDFEPLEEDQEIQVPAMFGNWICTPPAESFRRMRTTCARLVPKDDSLEDPAYISGADITVMTYYSSRHSGRTHSPSPVNGSDAFYADNGAFEQFTFSISDAFAEVFEGANYLTSSMIGFVAAILVSSF